MLIKSIVLNLILLPVSVTASTPQEDANAAIGIAVAYLEIGKQADLPDAPPRSEPPETHHASDTGLTDEAGAALDVPIAGLKDEALPKPDIELQRALDAIAELQAMQSKLAQDVDDANKELIRLEAENKQLQQSIQESAEQNIPNALPPQLVEPITPVDLLEPSDLQSAPAFEDAPKAVLSNPVPIGPASIAPPIEVIEPVQAHAPMRLLIDPPAEGVGGPSAVEAIVITAPWCTYCHKQEDENGEGNADVHFTYVNLDNATPEIKAVVKSGGGMIPVTYFHDRNGKPRYYVGKISTVEFAKRIQRSDPPENHGRMMASSGFGGAIQASPQIQQALEFWSSKIGKGVKGSFEWDCKQRSFNLLHKVDWSAVSMFGTSGRIDVAAPGAIGLPVSTLGFSYRIRGSDVLFNPDEIVVPGLAGKLAVSQSSMQATEPMGIIGIDDLLLAANIVSLVRDLFSLLWPSVDLDLPATISATASMPTDDMLAIDFQSGPTVRIVMLFSFQLKITRVEVTQKSVRVLFSGSRWVTERTFQVQ